MASPLSPIHPLPFLSSSSTATTLTRRSLLLSSTLTTTLPTTPLSLPPQLDTNITDRVYLDFSLCPTYFRNATAADSIPLCSDPSPLGRLFILNLKYMSSFKIEEFLEVYSFELSRFRRNNATFDCCYFISGLAVVTAIASIPTYKPSERIRQLNDLAEFFGDERAQKGRTLWNRPLKTVYISDCGELQVTKPSMSPTLP
ncbi:hypothetical protein GOBAR_DD04701 [Gossypium barbadense]|nr:hypothetical protein GOBAR_DD04701 [Gossypium barbadense]